jgi:drug/metabolite transporter (DMT)-like permease
MIWTQLLPPITFVCLWSTGFIGGRLGMPHADPLTFLLIRFAIASALLTGLAMLSDVAWPRGKAALHLAISGLLVHGVYLGGVFVALSMGVSAGLVALIAGMQPLLTGAASGWLLGVPVRPLQWAGLALGLAGVVLVLWEKLAAQTGVPLAGVGLAVVALLAITAGTLYQKRFVVPNDLRSATAWQYLVCTLVYGATVPWLEPMRVAWTPEFLFALAWLVLVLSVGAIMLFFTLIRRGSAAGVASLMYLVPSLTALMAWGLFGEHLGLLALLGMAITATAVALVNRPPKTVAIPSQREA